MRLFLAVLFIFAFPFTVLTQINKSYPGHAWPWWAEPVMWLTGAAAPLLALYLFNKRGLRPNFPGKSLEQRIAELDRDGLLIREDFRAKRAFDVETFDDEGLHYYIELDDGRVLYLHGQYLDDYGPIEEEAEPEDNRPREFPCTEFQILRDRNREFFLHIQCGGSVLEPEVMAQPFTREELKQGLPADGDIITSQTYDEIKAQRIKE